MTPTIITVRSAAGTPKQLNCYATFNYGGYPNELEYAIAPDSRTGGMSFAVFHVATGLRVCPIEGGHSGLHTDDLVERARASLYKFVKRYSAPVVYQAIREAQPIKQVA